MAVVKYGERLDSESGDLKIFDDFINDYIYRLTDQSNAERGTPVSSIKYVFHAEKGWGYREFIPSTTFEYKGKKPCAEQG